MLKRQTKTSGHIVHCVHLSAATLKPLTGEVRGFNLVAVPLGQEHWLLSSLDCFEHYFFSPSFCFHVWFPHLPNPGGDTNPLRFESGRASGIKIHQIKNVELPAVATSCE